MKWLGVKSDHLLPLPAIFFLICCWWCSLFIFGSDDTDNFFSETLAFSCFGALGLISAVHGQRIQFCTDYPGMWELNCSKTHRGKPSSYETFINIIVMTDNWGLCSQADKQERRLTHFKSQKLKPNLQALLPSVNGSRSEQNLMWLMYNITYCTLKIWIMKSVLSEPDQCRISPTIFRWGRENPCWPRLHTHLHFVNIYFPMRVLQPRRCRWCSLLIQSVFIFWIIAKFGAILFKLPCASLDPQQQTCSRPDDMWQTDRQGFLALQLNYLGHIQQFTVSKHHGRVGIATILSLMFSWSKEGHLLLSDTQSHSFHQYHAHPGILPHTLT